MWGSRGERVMELEVCVPATVFNGTALQRGFCCCAVHLKRKIRLRVKPLWQAANNTESPRTRRMRPACFVTAEKLFFLLKQNVSGGLARQCYFYNQVSFSPRWACCLEKLNKASINKTGSKRKKNTRIECLNKSLFVSLSNTNSEDKWDGSYWWRCGRMLRCCWDGVRGSEQNK